MRYFDGSSERLVIRALHAREIRADERDRQQCRDQEIRQFAHPIADPVEMAAGLLAKIGERRAHLAARSAGENVGTRRPMGGQDFLRDEDLSARGTEGERARQTGDRIGNTGRTRELEMRVARIT